jgi:acetylglutamate kinase
MDQQQFRLIRAAAPYVNRMRGRVMVIKAGGGLFEDAQTRRQLFEQLSLVHMLGAGIVLVHGGGPQIDALCARLGVETRKHNGRRITTPEVMEAVAMALPGHVQSRIVAGLMRAGVPAVGTSTLSAGSVQGHRRLPSIAPDGTSLDFGHVLDIDKVDSGMIRHLLAGGYVPVVAPVAMDEQGELCNINADTVAARLAIALGAEKLVFLLGVRGVLMNASDSGTLVPELSMTQLRQLESDGVLTGGMLPKAGAALSALEGGVARVHLVSGIEPDALLQELLTNEGSGTMVVPDA